MSNTSLEVLFTPAEYEAPRDWSDRVCVVFDILRATTTMVTALYNGADAIIPVAGIPDAINLTRARPDLLLAGERNGLPISPMQAEGVAFDFGNSPREFYAERVRGRTIVLTTTNGTRALRACASARTVLIGSFHNLRSVTTWIRRNRPANLVMICSGTREEPALEDTLAAGALCERIWPYYVTGHVSDSAEIARRLYPLFQTDLTGAMQFARNGRRLLEHRELRADVALCVQREIHQLVAALQPDGRVIRIPSVPLA